jgi:hypothetical protein
MHCGWEQVIPHIFFTHEKKTFLEDEGTIVFSMRDILTFLN